MIKRSNHINYSILKFHFGIFFFSYKGNETFGVNLGSHFISRYCYYRKRFSIGYNLMSCISTPAIFAFFLSSSSPQFSDFSRASFISSKVCVMSSSLVLRIFMYKVIHGYEVRCDISVAAPCFVSGEHVSSLRRASIDDGLRLVYAFLLGGKS